MRFAISCITGNYLVIIECLLYEVSKKPINKPFGVV